MTVDERIDKLTGRHEALTQFVELSAAENRDRDAKIGNLILQVVESVQKLAVIAESHERRITHLEGDPAA